MVINETFSLYVLIKNKKPIYVGVTSDIKRRESEHRIKKKFDIITIVKTYKKKSDALIAENSLIRFNGLFDLGLSNAKHCSDVNLRNYINIYNKNDNSFIKFISLCRK